MKNILVFSFAIMLLMSSFICNAQTEKKETVAATRIEAYYFHNAARCVTCKTVESEAKADLENLYESQVTFKSLNLEDDATKAIAKKLEVSGQTLLVVKGSKKVNLTNEGFMYARTNPKKFKSIIKEKVDAL
ncbi:MAG: nitrophenyl compound nitroreductase subunit ArsF family protein [Bacteroidota bacterium]|nr:nitrophenyl compound nitroreductase subunit ArsF family protein [Bacteroidota bacterium]MDO9615780.1 nitrophenyl compound nitroreductase subunit ArsF family protein [Bacteroidota bacterium]